MRAFCDRDLHDLMQRCSLLVMVFFVVVVVVVVVRCFLLLFFLFCFVFVFNKQELLVANSSLMQEVHLLFWNFRSLTQVSLTHPLPRLLP